MENLNSQQDSMIYTKSKRRVIRHLIYSYIFLCIYFVIAYFIFQVDLLRIPDSTFRLFAILMIVAQLAIYGLMFMMLSTGNKMYRTMYWFVLLFSFTGFYYPISTLFHNPSNILGYLTLILLMLMKCYGLYQLGLYFYQHPSAKVYFDYVLEVDEEGNMIEEEDEEEEVEEQPQPIKRSMDPRTIRMPSDDLIEEIDLEEKTHRFKVYTYPQMAIRLGIYIYGSLMAFPIIIQLLTSNFLMSNDMRYTFALKDGFLLCLFTAIVWTLPLFYLYFDHPSSKKLVSFCFVAELIRLGLYIPTLLSYIRGDVTTYPLRVFIIFGCIQLVRYILLFITVKPVFSLDVPSEDDDDYMDVS